MVDQAIKPSTFTLRRERGNILAGDGGDGKEVDVGVFKS